MLFQIEEPDGSPLDAEGPGAAVGMDLSTPYAGVAVAIGGNAEALVLPNGFAGPETSGLRDAAGDFIEHAVALALLALAGVAERTLSRPVTHAVLVVPTTPSPASAAALAAAAAASGLSIMRILTVDEAASRAAESPAPLRPLHGAAIVAEDDSFALLRS
jgi:hypothetical protein